MSTLNHFSEKIEKKYLKGDEKKKKKMKVGGKAVFGLKKIIAHRGGRKVGRQAGRKR